MSYMTALWPLGALVLAWLVVRTWRGAANGMRAAIALVFVMMVLDAARAIAASRLAADRLSPYLVLHQPDRRLHPVRRSGLGLQHYWLGLRQFEYRTWLLPITCRARAGTTSR